VKSARTSRALFAGLSTVDVLHVVRDLPRRDSKVRASSQHILAGGPATNAAITFAFLGGASLLATAVGRHPIAAVIRQELDSRSVLLLYDMAHTRDEVPPISSIMVMERTGERSVVSANAKVFPPLQPELNPTWLDSVEIVLVDGHYMSLCIKIAAEASSRRIPVVLDGGSWKSGMDELLSHVDIAICSEDFRPPGCASGPQVFDFLGDKGVSHSAITRGGRPVSYMSEGLVGEIPVEAVDVVDTLGAGDVLHGAFCYSMCQTGYQFVESLARASRIATFSCLFRGTRRWMDDFAEIDATFAALGHGQPGEQVF
jgi:sugar/nucleoside kinase (ribokinase family)